jgi:demethylmenaquinone methyltransferase/2-methoxy-6-polyprenyl-1,4-benzoquinol methylase
MFAAVARRYDLLNHLLSAGLDHRWRARAARHVRPESGANVLDLCTGTGDLAVALLRRPGARVIGIDFSRPMLARARTKLGRARLAGRAALLEADAECLPLADASVDAVACAFGLRNLADADAGLREMVRVVRPGGRVVVLEFHRPAGMGLAGRLFRLYFRRLLPRLASWIARDDRGGYRYLVESVEAFGPPGATAEAMRAAGLEGVEVEFLPGGVAAVTSGLRPVGDVDGGMPPAPLPWRRHERSGM